MLKGKEIGHRQVWVDYTTFETKSNEIEGAPIAVF